MAAASASLRRCDCLVPRARIIEPVGFSLCSTRRVHEGGLFLADATPGLSPESFMRTIILGVPGSVRLQRDEGGAYDVMAISI